MSNKLFMARSAEIVVFTSSEYDNDVQEFQESVNSWLHTQPDNVVIEDIIYKYSPLGQKGKEGFSVVIVSRTACEKELKELD